MHACRCYTVSSPMSAMLKCVFWTKYILSCCAAAATSQPSTSSIGSSAPSTTFKGKNKNKTCFFNPNSFKAASFNPLLRNSLHFAYLYIDQFNCNLPVCGITYGCAESRPSFPAPLVTSLGPHIVAMLDVWIRLVTLLKRTLQCVVWCDDM